LKLDPALRRIATVVVLGAVMSILDTAIVSVAIDTLSRDFHTPVSTIQWVTTGYLLALAVVIPVTGWAMDRFGARRMWMISLVLFVAGSVLCGAAWSATALIVFRVLQGLGGGMILPIGQAILARAAGPQRMGRVMSVIGVPMLMGPVLGPVVGGLIVSTVSWRWIFYVNVPIGIVALALSWRTLKPVRNEKVAHHFDLVGFLLLSPGLALFVYALSEVGSKGGFSAEVLLLALLGVALIAAFAWHALRAESALLDLHLYRFRSFAVSNVAMFLIGAALFASLFLLPLYYQVVRGYGALAAGLLMAPQGLGAAAVMRPAGLITDRIGPRRIVPLGVVLMVIGSIPFTLVTTSTSDVILVLALAVRGVGLGLTLIPFSASAYLDLDHAAIPRATTTTSIVRQVGGSIGTALVAVVLQSHVEHDVAGSTGLSTAAAAHLPAAVSAGLAHAFASTFWWVLGMVALVMVPALLLSRRRTAEPAGSPVHADQSAEPLPATE
jgi:EmrB/QacA subfamily drug resistance transporter